MDAELAVHEFQPELISRRGELIAWVGCLIVGAGWALLILLDQGVYLLISIVFVLLLLAAASISLGNWMDRKTRLRLGSNGIAYQNGLRNVRLNWTEIREVRVLPAQWGQKVQIIGEQSYFSFSTLGEVKANDRIIGKTGFADGEMILKQIIENAHLNKNQTAQPGSPENSYYYSRK